MWHQKQIHFRLCSSFVLHELSKTMISISHFDEAREVDIINIQKIHKDPLACKQHKSLRFTSVKNQKMHKMIQSSFCSTKIEDK